ncbi:MAG TPA: M28 family peptidase [Thermoanaerobaculia bacterium]|jgi:Zn-dependent M28 family amino/carboxypeptidase|nr:M28 family peptidase [Thermoanaerobaculia bacterium]
MLALLLFAAISAANVKAHIDFLASDVLEGRETGSRGYDVAAEYVASEFEALGLEHSFQPVRFRTAMIDAANCTMRLGDRTFAHKKEVIFRPDFTRTASDAEGDVVFVGFGLKNDYATMDVHGKIVAMLSGAPPNFPSDQRAFYSDSLRKLQLAASRGAIGVMTIPTRTDAKRFSWEKAVAQPDMRGMRTLDFDQVSDVVPEIRASVGLGPTATAALFAHAPVTLETVLDDAEKSISHSFPTNLHASIHTATTHGTAESENVVGVLRGSTKPDEYVVYTAHLDHLGMKADGDDRIYNGALDNASGDAALIEIARAFAALPQRPARSIAFVAVTGEEKGELGSNYFAAHPAIDEASLRTRHHVVANINMDMFTMLFPVGDVIALGAEHSTLGDSVADAAKRSGFTVSPDPLPEEVRFIRSDQYSFVKHGIPAITFKAGSRSLDPAVDGDKVTREWLRNVYHTVHDNPDQKLDYASGARWADLNFYIGLAAANAPDAPQWKPNDFFGGMFGHR